MQARIRLLLAIGIALLIPAAAAFAATNPLVPCNGISCQACHLAALAQNIIKFALLLAIPIAAGMFAWAGALYITARGDTGQISKATKIFGSVALGFVLALSGWLVVNTILYVVIADKSQFADSNWFTIKCVSNDEATRPKNKTLKDLSNLLQLSPVTPGIDTGEGGGRASEELCSQDPNYFKFDSSRNVCYGEYAEGSSLPKGYKCPDTHYNFDSVTGTCTGDDGTRTKPVKEGGATGLKPPDNILDYQTGIQQQTGDASGPLNALLSCMAGVLPGDAGQISSISDSKITTGAKSWLTCRTGGQSNGCAHSSYSCHYGGRTCGDESYAVDFGDEQNSKYIIEAANYCGADYVGNEGNHIHISVGKSCGCN